MNNMMNTHSMMRHNPYGYGGMNSLMMNAMSHPMHSHSQHQHTHQHAMQQHQPNLAMTSFNPASTFYCSSSVTTMTTDQHGRPQLYESTSSTRGGPGGTREVRSTVRDSTTGLQQMSIGHHIQDRGHVTERRRNRYTGEEEENEEYINIDETEGETFENDWSSRMRASSHGANHGRLQLTQGGRRRNGSSPQQLALTAPPVANTSTSSPSPHHQGSHKNKMLGKKKDNRGDKEKKWKRPFKKSEPK